MRDSKKVELRRVLFKEKHPLEKLKRIGLGSLTVEGIPRGKYRLIEQKEAEKLRKFHKSAEEEGKGSFARRPQRTQSSRRSGRKEPV
jgi:hypothetical protein